MLFFCQHNYIFCHFGILKIFGNPEGVKAENPTFLVNTMTELKISDILKL